MSWQVEVAQDRLRDRVADLCSRKGLSGDGRRRQLAKVKTDADTAMQKLRAAEEQNRVRREEKLLRTLFGNTHLTTPPR